MVLAHLGIAAFVIGVTMVKGHETERDVKMNVGDTVAVAGYVFRFDGVTEQRGPNYRAARGAVSISRNGTHVETLYPEKRQYNAGGMPMTNAAIDSGLRRYLRLDGRARRRQRVDHPRLLEAVHHLGVGRLRDDGAGRPPRDQRSPLPHGGAARRGAGAIAAALRGAALWTRTRCTPKTPSAGAGEGGS